jgi:hypothetical protein
MFGRYFSLLNNDGILASLIFICLFLGCAHVCYRVIVTRQLPQLQVTISEFKKNAQELHRPNSMHSEKCLRHAGEALKLYCETCEVLICRDCTMIDHTKPEHRYVCGDANTQR